MSLGTTISRLRAEKKLSQGDLADALGVSRQSVSKEIQNSDRQFVFRNIEGRHSVKHCEEGLLVETAKVLCACLSEENLGGANSFVKFLLSVYHPCNFFCQKLLK